MSERASNKVGDADWREAVAAYHDGEADAALRGEVERLLASSPEARAYLVELRTLDVAVSHLAESLPAPPKQRVDAGLARILGQAEKSAPRRARLTRIAYVGVAAAAAVLLVFGVALLIGPTEPEHRPDTPGTFAASPTNGTGADEPEEELLELLALLSSDLDFEVLATLDPADLELLTDMVYYDTLSAYDDED